MTDWKHELLMPMTVVFPFVEERLVRVPLVDEFDVPDAIPVTTVWGQR